MKTPGIAAGFALPLLGLELFAFFAAASAPSPLLVPLQEVMHFGPAALTVVFATYAVALLCALLVAGALSDHLGRKPVIVVALLVQAASMLTFLNAGSVEVLIAARGVQGLATGIAAGALTAGILEAAPYGSRIGALVNGFAPLAGLASGGLASGLALRTLDSPMRVVFVTLIGLFLVAAVLTVLVPETAVRRPGAIASLVPRAAIPARARPTFRAVMAVTFGLWALGGLYLSLVPLVLPEILGLTDPLMSGIAIALLNATGALTPLLTGKRGAGTMTLLGGILIASGAVILLTAIWMPSAVLFFGGTVVAGMGFGSAFSGTLQLLGPLAEPSERAELFAAVYVVSYVAFSTPAVIAGILVPVLGLTGTVTGYVALLVGLGAVGTWTLSRLLGIAPMRPPHLAPALAPCEEVT